MKKASLYILIALGILLIGGGVLVWEKEKPAQSIPETMQTTKTIEQPTTTDEIESVRDLIDGEYAFTPIDTSDWQTYRNEELGFEVKIPKNWEMREMQRNQDGEVICWFSQKGEWYLVEGGKENAIAISVSDKYSSDLTNFHELILKRKKYSGERILSTVIGNKKAIVDTKFFQAIFFRSKEDWSIASIPNISSYPEVNNIYPMFLQTFRFLK